MSGYIGTQPVPQATQTRDAFTATNNQTSFPTSGYTPEFLDVFLNGVKLAAADYTATNGSDVVLAAGATTGDILEVVSYGTFEVLNPTFDGNVTFTGNASFGDNDKAIFGAGSDLQIYHNGGDSLIADTGTGDLYIRGSNNIFLQKGDGSETFMATADDGAVTLYHNNASKLATTATGITVTGTVAATAYTGDGSNLTGVGSPSIDDNGNATAITIDSGENVMVGVASVQTQSGTTAGTSLYGGSNAGLITAGRNGDILRLNRQSTDGDIALFKKDGTTVGSIGVDQYDNYTVSSNRELIISTDRTVSRSYVLGDGGTSNGVFYPTTDNDADFGSSSKRWKDLYLSGGIYLGGAVAANKLDDYETGTFTPNVDTGSIDIAEGAYVKVGDLVHCTLTVGHSMNASSSSPIQFNGLPFTSSNASDGSHGTVFCRYVNNFPNAVQVMTSNTRIRLWASGSTAFSTINHNNITSATYALFYIGLTYRAA